MKIMFARRIFPTWIFLTSSTFTWSRCMEDMYRLGGRA